MLPEELLKNFDPITLSEMDKVSLMNRVDTKYTINKKVLSLILDKIKKDYYILEMEQKRQFPYLTLYLDTTDNKLYLAHHNGKLNRHKIRLRKYITSNHTFLEVKRKEKGIRTIKKRILVDNINPDLNVSEHEFLSKHIPFSSKELESKMYTDFTRTTLVAKTFKERVTLDTNLFFYSDPAVKSNLNETAILELKREGDQAGSILKYWLSHFGVNPNGISKYCLGRALVENTLKQNNFKRKIRTLNKIENGEFYYRNI